MLDKYLGFINISTEDNVIESFLEHNRIDGEEIELLITMLTYLTQEKMDDVENYYGKIRSISIDSSKAFESVAEQIINANFDHQKQHDLLRIYQRIGSISEAIISSAKRMVILKRINGSIPTELHSDILILMNQLKDINIMFKKALNQYLDNKRNVIDLINKIDEIENTIDHQRAVCLEILYRVGNEQHLPIGTFNAIENIIEHIEDASDSIKEAGTSLEWLLLY